MKDDILSGEKEYIIDNYRNHFMNDLNVKLVKRQDGIFFVQDGVEYNLYKLPKGFVIRGNVDLSNMGLTKLPNMSAVEIDGHFCCSLNPLKSLIGCPHTVRIFSCEYTDIRDMRGGPKLAEEVHVSHNRLISLDGAPRTLMDDERLWEPNEEKYWVEFLEFDCSDNELTSLTGLPAGWDWIHCENNQITTLSAIESYASRSDEDIHVYCQNNNLTKLDISPRVKNIRICQFSGNPCTNRYIEYLLKKRGVVEKPSSVHIAAMVKALEDNEYDLEEIYVYAEDIRVANRALFNQKKIFDRGVSAVGALSNTKKQSAKPAGKGSR